jgi:hypothetical protein
VYPWADGIHLSIRWSRTRRSATSALGFWNALREVFPEAWEGRCWFHKTANVLAALPKSAHPGGVNAPQLVALGRAGATFVNGKHVERPEDQPVKNQVGAAA